MTKHEVVGGGSPANTKKDGGGFGVARTKQWRMQSVCPRATPSGADWGQEARYRGPIGTKRRGVSGAAMRDAPLLACLVSSFLFWDSADEISG